MSVDLVRRGLLVLAGLLIAAGGGLLMVSARGGWPDLLPPANNVAVANVLAHLRVHDAASVTGNEKTRVDALRAARTELAALLARRPSDGDQWALLAQIESSFVGFDSGVKAALEMSRMTARLEQAAIEKRIQLGIRLWPALDGPEREHVAGDMRALLSVPDPRHRVIATLADIARGEDESRRAVVRTAVTTTAPGWLTTFEHFLVNPPQF